MPVLHHLITKNSRPPSMNLNRQHYRIYLRPWYEKRKASIFYISLASVGYPPRPSFNVNVFFLCV